MIAALFAATITHPVELSVYATSYQGQPMAGGGRYDSRKLTAARTEGDKRVPMGSVWLVSYKGRTVRVTITDTGSWRGRGGMVWLDLSSAGWQKVTGAKPGRVWGTARRVK